MKDLRKVLLHTAHDKGICADGYRQMLESADKDTLVDYYVANPDWCMERNFPDLETLREHFADCGNKGVFVDRTFHGELLNDLQTYIFHNCKGEIKVGMNVDKCIIPMLYFANGCNITVSCDIPYLLPIRVPIYATDEWANCINSTVGDNCMFARYTIKLIDA